ncbi:CLIP domain-containing serine protease 14D-like [Leguminivora glycinivorella]|uniref:CLIP domain-containing serine protease 14D-like n=1 Tax=Leguminivora glycinivorella TaxID=1035111 RepID=UPI00200E12E5|nr:CLIP domain-containing serine protease 14D-like [Leguminivora glycinivorella]
MNDKFSILCVLSLLTWTPSYTADIKNCSDCTASYACAAFVTATENLIACTVKLPSCVPVVESQVVEQLSSNGCGRDDSGNAKVCCAELTAGVERALASVDHPNLPLLPENCGVGEDDEFANRVAGGVPVLGIYDYPWMIFISYQTQAGPQFQCGGSLINDRYVLTAAHCLSRKEVLTVRVREYDVETKGPPDIPIEEAIPHPGYRRRPVITDDIGLLRLKNPVNLYSKNAGTICLPVTRDLQNRDIVAQGATIAQRRKAEENYESVTLLYADVTIYSTEYCREQYNKSRKHGEEDKMINKICSDSNLKGACRGVSGAPLMVWAPFGDRKRFIQYGLVTYGPNRCGTLFPEVYTDVSKYITWILNTIRS